MRRDGGREGEPRAPARRRRCATRASRRIRRSSGCRCSAMNLTTLRETLERHRDPQPADARRRRCSACIAMASCSTCSPREPSYSTLATNLDPAETAKAEKALGAAGIAYKTESGGTQIAVVSRPAMSQARVALAEKGVLNGGHVGFELFDKTSLGATDFQQKVNYQRALEGEIARDDRADPGRHQRRRAARAARRHAVRGRAVEGERGRAASTGGSSLDAATVARHRAPRRPSSVKGLDAQQRHDHRRDRRAALADRAPAARG